MAAAMLPRYCKKVLLLLFSTPSKPNANRSLGVEGQFQARRQFSQAADEWMDSLRALAMDREANIVEFQFNLYSYEEYVNHSHIDAKRENTGHREIQD
ncbi:hypothetical protein RB195_000714 [Necator americanus]|uniref:Uncharacterized protein n=1 Tax=Necator americanus TaxID=51031 RepID=A0ABR1DB11_NECAM